eukprot:jgi/Botrbrau1/12443/Bobra.0094s0012.2
MRPTMKSMKYWAIPQEVARNQELHPSTREVTLTHVDDKGQAVMVNVGHKEQSRRSATASARVLLGERVYGLVTANMITKGNVQEVARLAGIMAAKQTSNLIPLCHNIPLSVVDVDFCMDSREWSMVVKARAETTAQTGVEMEAMVAATIASLTVYDMVKGVDKSVYISDVQLDEKSGGKSGTYKRSAAIVPETSHN